MMKISNEYAQEQTQILFDHIDTIATVDDIEFIQSGIDYLRDRGADEYAFLVELKLQDLRNLPHRVYMGIDKNGDCIYHEYYGFNF